MTLEAKLRQAAVMAAVDISLKRMEKSPERCARNLVELGLSAYPNKIPKEERSNFYNNILEICKSGDTQQARDVFFNIFLKQ
jgi:hypothetical protein